MPFYSPLRYPGGKRKLVPFFKLLISEGWVGCGEYVEAFAGGSAIALALVIDGFVEKAWINDVDPSLYAFWYCVLEEPEALCRRILSVEVTMEEWRRQREIQFIDKADLVDLGFSTFFLNRTNRSGIILGGVLGGKKQHGCLRLDARFNRQDLVRRIEKISRQAEKFRLTCLDAAELLSGLSKSGPSLVYLDPPYFRSRTRLYKDDYESGDHEDLSAAIRELRRPWVLTYNDCPVVRRLYANLPIAAYSLHYAAGARYQGSEVMVWSPHFPSRMSGALRETLGSRGDA